MIDWEAVKVVVSIVSLVVSILTLCGVGVYMSLHTKKRFEKKQAESDEIEELKEQKRIENLMKLINGALDNKLAPIANDVSSVKCNLALNTEGTVTILRNDMKKSLDFYKERGYASSNDKANWMELYNTYGKLGGNHFKEYVDEWKKEIEGLPLRKKKQRLNEKR